MTATDALSLVKITIIRTAELDRMNIIVRLIHTGTQGRPRL